MDRTLTYATLCSGIEAPSVAWRKLPLRPVFFSEVGEPQSRLLKHHYPEVPNLGDLTTIPGAQWRDRVDVLWASPPCQSFSKNGKQRGLADPRGRITLRVADLIDEINPKIICIENVKGMLYDKSNAFGHLLSRLCGCSKPLRPPGLRWERNGCVVGPRRTLAWRVFDAAFSGLAARRERVFLVGCDRDSGVDAADLLFERQESTRHPGARWSPESRHASAGDRAGSPQATRWFNGDTTPKHNIERAGTLRAAHGTPQSSCVYHDGRAYNLDATFREALMGFPAGYTNVAGLSEAARCAGLGNSVAVPDCRWIGSRIVSALALDVDRRAGAARRSVITGRSGGRL